MLSSLCTTADACSDACSGPPILPCATHANSSSSVSSGFRVVMDQLTRTCFHSYDPRLVSLALQHPLTAAGESSERPYGSIQPHLVAAADCAAARRGHVTEAAMDTARSDSAVVNRREVGEKFKEAKGASNTPLLHWTAADAEQLHTRVRLPSEWQAQSQGEAEAEADGVPVLAVYDFHFRRVPSADIDSLGYRATILPASEFDQCWTRADWEAHRNATPTATTH